MHLPSKRGRSGEDFNQDSKGPRRAAGCHLSIRSNKRQVRVAALHRSGLEGRQRYQVDWMIQAMRLSIAAGC